MVVLSGENMCYHFNIGRGGNDGQDRLYQFDDVGEIRRVE